MSVSNISQLAKKIREEGESWQSALKRASMILKSGDESNAPAKKLQKSNNKANCVGKAVSHGKATKVK